MQPGTPASQPENALTRAAPSILFLKASDEKQREEALSLPLDELITDHR